MNDIADFLQKNWISIALTIFACLGLRFMMEDAAAKAVSDSKKEDEERRP